MPVMEVIFWIAVLVIVYTLFGYPLLTLILAGTICKRIDRKPITPRVSFIIAAYNEEDVIAEKLEQTLALAYPPEQLEVIVASDGSTDRTDEIVRSFADRGVKLYRGEGRKGKTETLNGAVAAATGDIVIFSDATGVYNDEAIRELVANFNDPAIGCVTGRVAYRYGTDATSTGFKGYQRIAVAVRQAESRFGSQTSVSGSIHAIRRELYRPAHPGFSLDVIDAVHAVSQGRRVVYDNRAVSLEDSRTRLGDEFRCRVRISVRATSMIPYVLSQLFRHGRLGYMFQMVSHKFLRWWLWCLLLVALVTNLLLAWHSPAYAFLAGLQGLFYLMAVVGLLAARWDIGIPFVPLLAFFLLGNVAACTGAIKCLAGKRMAKWEPVR
jgi:cellulose synthase/poly-beta-1,6-N-acetylglucosamine synthase-like glycosyltransferase